MIKFFFLAISFLYVFCSSVQAEINPVESINLTPQEQAFVDAHPVIRVANEMDWPPFDFNEFGRPKGLCIGHIKLLANKVGFKIEFVNGYTWFELLTMFQQKQIDVMPVMYKNKEREAYTLFTKPYYKGQLGFFARDDAWGTHTENNLSGKTVGIQKSHGSIPVIRERIPSVKLIEVETTDELVTLLATDRLDAIIGNPLLFYHKAKEHQISNIRLAGYLETLKADEHSSNMHIGIRKDWPLFQQILQKALDAVSHQEMNDLVTDWAGINIQLEKKETISLTDAERSFLVAHPVIRVQNEDDYPPYDFSDSGEPLGFSIDYLKLIAKKTNLNFTFINGSTWEQILEKIQGKNLDVIHTCLKTKERGDYVSFTDSYIKATYALILPAETDIRTIADVAGKKLAVLKGSQHVEFINKLGLGIVVVEYDTTREVLRSVLFKECDAAYESMQLAGYILKEEGMTGLDFKPVPMLERGSGDWRIGVRKDWPELLSIINKGMTAISRKEMGELKSKWFGMVIEKDITIGLNQKEKAFINSHPVIKVSNELDYLPFDFSIGKKPQGYSIDILNILAERIGIKVEYVNGYSWNQLKTLFIEEELDLLHSINQLPARKNLGLFSKPYYYYKNHWVVKRNAPEIDTIEQLFGKTVAVVKGWSQEEFISTTYPKVHLLIVADLDSMIEVVSKGKADAMLGEVPVMRYIFKKKGITDLKLSGWAKEFDKGGSRRFHFLAQNNEPELITMLDKAIASLTPGDLEELDRKWFGEKEKSTSVTSGSVRLTSEEKNFLTQKGEIIVSAHPDWMPYLHFDDAGDLEGMGADYFSLFEERVGVPFRIMPNKTSQDAIVSVQERKSDAFLLAPVSAELDTHVDLTTPYISFPYVIATNNDKLFIDDIGSKLDENFGVVHGTAIIQKLKKYYPTINLLEVDTIKEGLKKVRDNEVFGFIDTSGGIAYTIQKEMMMDVKIAGTLRFNIELAVATQYLEPLLGEIFQKAVDSLTNEDKQRIYNKWIAVNFEKGIDYSLVWKIGVFSFIIFIGIMYWNRQLASARQQTQIAQNLLLIKNEELRRQASTDRLTGLYNRLKLDQVLNSEVLRFVRYNSHLSVIILDIDYFKKVNDTLGHQAGDKVLQQMAATLRDNVREVDIVGRWGGEEFLIICPETNLVRAMILAENMRTKIEHQDMGKGVHITASFGIAELTKGEKEVDLIRKADNALYKAKEKGRNRIESI
ncbi:MAG: transporter substrate-binding domain-containing protein [Desulfotalea sp.]